MSKSLDSSQKLVLFVQQQARWLKWLFALLLFGLLSYQISQHSDLSEWWANMQLNWQKANHRYFLFAAITLMPINWGIELVKWRSLLAHQWRPPYWLSVKIILSGISISLLTPNRVGEHLGRAILAPPQQRSTVVLTSVVGGICQWLALITLGVPALASLLAHKGLLALHWSWLICLLLFAAIILGIWLTPIFYPIVLKKVLATNKKYLRWLRLQLFRLQHIPRAHFLAAYLLALLRTLVYSLQYLLLLYFFDISLSFLLGISGIFSIILIQASIPLPPGFGVITKSELALWLWGTQLVNPLAILSASLSLHILNLIIPALLGSFMVVKKENPNP